MSTTLERYEREAVLLGERDPEPSLLTVGRGAASDVLERHLDMLAIQAELGGQSSEILGDVLKDMRLPSRVRENIMRSREARQRGWAVPKAGYGPFRQLNDGAIALTNQSAVVGTGEAGIYPSAQYTAFAANTLRVGQIWQLIVFGIGTTPASSQGNITITPRYGTTTGGVSLGASVALALAANASSIPWQMEMYFVIRDSGLAGANSHAVESGTFSCPPTLIAAATGMPVFGSAASVAIDLSIAAGLFMGFTLGSASDSFVTTGVLLESLN